MKLHFRTARCGSATIKRIRAIAFAVATVVLVLAGCDNTEEPLFDIDYKAWDRTVAEDLTYAIPGHGAKRRGIYINDIGTSVQKNESATPARYVYPAGTILVKENYENIEGSVPETLTIMIKAPGDERASADWIWLVKYTETGEEELIAKSEFCINCHSSANSEHPYGDLNKNNEFRDYVFFPYVPVPSS